MYLYSVLNKIKPGAVAKVQKGKISFVHMENIEAFLKGCAQIGLNQTSLFNTLDLYENKNMNLVWLPSLIVDVINIDKHKP
jgi:hypothetical protein